MKVTLLLGTFPWKPSGGAKVAFEYANGLAARGHDVEVLFARHLPNWKRCDNPPLRRVLKGVLLRIVEGIRQPRPTWFPLAKRVRTRSVSKYKSSNIPDGDVVIATFWPTAEVVADLPSSKGKGAYLIQHFEDWASDSDRVEATWRLPLHKLLVSKWLYRRALLQGIPSQELTYVPNSIPVNIFAPQVGAQNRKAVVSMLYGEPEWKGAKDGIAALVKARQSVPELRAVLFGVWKRPPDLPAWMEYHCRPERNDLIHKIYGRSAVFLCPSHTEGWGLPGAEALASECSLVTTDNGGAGDYAMDQITARVVAPKAVDDMARAVVDLLQNASARIALAKRGRAHIQRFQFARSLGHLEQRLLDLAATA